MDAIRDFARRYSVCRDEAAMIESELIRMLRDVVLYCLSGNKCESWSFGKKGIFEVSLLWTIGGLSVCVELMNGESGERIKRQSFSYDDHNEIEIKERFLSLFDC